jgi:hypothetical protein
MARAREIRRSAQRIATVFEKIVNQGLLVMYVEFRGHNVVYKGSEVCIGLGRIHLGHYREIDA